MEKTEKIVEYLRTQYDPEAIILHGSRAIGKERPHSDWDILLLFSSVPSKKSDRKDISGEDVEWKASVAPIQQEDILDTFSVVLQNAKVLWEREDTGTVLLQSAADEYAKGAQLTKEDHVRYEQFLIHKLHSLEDDLGTPYMFLRHLGEFFARATNWWFEILHDEHRKPFYVAFPMIQECDPEYHAHLMTLCEERSKEEKIEAAKEVIKKLFPNK